MQGWTLGRGGDAGGGARWSIWPEGTVTRRCGDTAGDNEIGGVIVDEKVEGGEPGDMRFSGEGREFDCLGRGEDDDGAIMYRRGEVGTRRGNHQRCIVLDVYDPGDNAYSLVIVMGSGGTFLELSAMEEVVL